jgi:hypothetical protein
LRARRALGGGLKIQSMDEEKLGKYERKHEGAYNAG